MGFSLQCTTEFKRFSQILVKNELTISSGFPGGFRGVISTFKKNFAEVCNFANMLTKSIVIFEFVLKVFFCGGGGGGGR